MTRNDAKDTKEQKVAAIVVNYNMPERADAIAEYILECVRCPVDLYVVDNGSDMIAPARYTTVRLAKNRQTTGGWLAGLEQARLNGNYFAYWFLITSMEFIGMADVLTPMVALMEGDDQVVGVHPALTADSTTAWKHLLERESTKGREGREGGRKARRVWMIDNIASLWRAEWYDEQGGFDPEMRYGWGIDLELSWKARSQGKRLVVMDDCQVKKVTDLGYSMGRMGMTAEERVRLASTNMAEVMEKKYGPEWDWKMRQEFVTDDLR